MRAREDQVRELIEEIERTVKSMGAPYIWGTYYQYQTPKNRVRYGHEDWDRQRIEAEIQKYCGIQRSFLQRTLRILEGPEVAAFFEAQAEGADGFLRSAPDLGKALGATHRLLNGVQVGTVDHGRWGRYPTMLDFSTFLHGMGDLLSYLKGYRPSEGQIEKYHCQKCGRMGVKLWRYTHDGSEGLCSFHATDQAGLRDEIDEVGKMGMKILPEDEYEERSDQIYNPEQGSNMLPWVPCPVEGTWGYSSVPPEACRWWRELPTR